MISVVSAFQPRPAALWRVRVSDGWAPAEVWTHPVWWECRIYWDGELHRSQAYRDAADAHRDADETKARLEGYNRERLPGPPLSLRALCRPAVGHPISGVR
jgi:hypothetical protein